MYPVYFKFTKIPKRALTWFKKAKELFGTPAKICFFQLFRPNNFFKTFGCIKCSDLGFDKSSEELISSQDDRQSFQSPTSIQGE